MVTITDTASKHIAELRAAEGYDDSYNLRVGVQGGGCSGLVYELDFDNAIQESDQLIEDNGVTLVINAKSMLYIAGTRLDFSDGLNGKGFQFINPNATRTCGCGESFAV